MKASRLALGVLIVCAVLVAAVTFALSFHGLDSYGQHLAALARLSWLVPLGVDGLTLVAVAATYLLRDAPWRVRAYAWLVFAVAVGASVAGNLSYAASIHLQVSGMAGSAAWPVLLALASHLVIVTRRALERRPDDTPESVSPLPQRVPMSPPEHMPMTPMPALPVTPQRRDSDTDTGARLSPMPALPVAPQRRDSDTDTGARLSPMPALPVAPPVVSPVTPAKPRPVSSPPANGRAKATPTEIRRLADTGMSRADIAKRTGASLRTVYRHLSPDNGDNNQTPAGDGPAGEPHQEGAQDGPVQQEP